MVISKMTFFSYFVRIKRLIVITLEHLNICYCNWTLLIALTWVNILGTLSRSLGNITFNQNVTCLRKWIFRRWGDCATRSSIFNVCVKHFLFFSFSRGKFRHFKKSISLIKNSKTDISWNLFQLYSTMLNEHIFVFIQMPTDDIK